MYLAPDCGLLVAMRTPLAALTMLTLTALTACGGGGEGGPMTVEELADQVGCSGFEVTPDVMMVREAGSCQIDGGDAYLYTFSDTEQRDAAPTKAGGGIVVEGDLWQVQVFDQATAEQVADATNAPPPGEG